MSRGGLVGYCWLKNLFLLSPFPLLSSKEHGASDYECLIGSGMLSGCDTSVTDTGTYVWCLCGQGEWPMRSQSLSFCLGFRRSATPSQRWVIS